MTPVKGGLGFLIQSGRNKYTEPVCQKHVQDVLDALLVLLEEPPVFWYLLVAQLGVQPPNAPTPIQTTQLAIYQQEGDGIRVMSTTQQQVLGMGIAKNFACGELHTLKKCHRILLQRSTNNY